MCGVRVCISVNLMQAQLIDGKMHFKGLVASPDGQKIFRAERCEREIFISKIKMHEHTHK